MKIYLLSDRNITLEGLISARGRTVSVIFGDGAGAAVVNRHDNLEEGIRSTHLHSEGKHAKELSLIGPSTKKWVHEVFENYDPDDMDYHPYMNGQLVFKNAVVRFSGDFEALAKNNLEPSDIDMLIPHQANLRIAQFVQKSLVFEMIRSTTTLCVMEIPQLHPFRLRSVRRGKRVESKLATM